MNMQKRAELRSKALHQEIVKKLRRHPSLWAIPRNNLAKWKKMRGGLPPALVEWEKILTTYSKEQILLLLESESEEAIRLRSSSPFTGLLTEAERRKIFLRYRIKPAKAHSQREYEDRI